MVPEIISWKNEKFFIFIFSTTLNYRISTTRKSKKKFPLKPLYNKDCILFSSEFLSTFRRVTTIQSTNNRDNYLLIDQGIKLILQN